MPLLWTPALIALSLAACNAGTSNAGIFGAVTVDGGSTGGGMAGTSDLPRMQQANSTLPNPMLRVVTLGSDATAPRWQQFAVALAQSGYWRNIAAEYGAGSLAVETAVVGPAPTTNPLTAGSLLSGQDSELENLLFANLGAGGTLGAGEPNTVLVIFTPAGLAVALDATHPSACKAGVFAWHQTMLLADGTFQPYVVVPDCGSLLGLDTMNSRTFAASHAMVGAITNPLGRGLSSVDDAHAVWQLVNGGTELADMCVAEKYGDNGVAVTPADLGFAVSQTWSDAAAKAGKPPCQPSADAYFGVSPAVTASVPMLLGRVAKTARGVTLPASSTATVTLNPHGQGTWTVSLAEVGTHLLTLSSTSLSVTAGKAATVQLTASSQAAAGGQEVLRITSKQGSTQHTEYLLIGN